MRGAFIALLLTLGAAPAAAQDVAPGISQPSLGVTPLPTLYHYPYVAEAGSTGAAGGYANLVRWLVNDLPGEQGPGFTVVELAQDAGWGGGGCANDRTALVNASDLDSCGPYEPAVNDWAILRSGVGMYGTAFDLYLELQSTTVIYVLLFPLGAHVAAPGAFVSPPAYDVPSVGSGSATPVPFTVVNGAYRMSIVADVTMIQLLSDNAGTRYWTYIGELNGAKSDGVPSDDRPFVIWDTPATHTVLASNTMLNRVAPDDDATVLVSGFLAPGASGTALGSGGDLTYLGVDYAAPVAVQFSDAADYHVAGYMRHVLAYARNAGALVQTADNCWFGASTAAASPGILIRGDCATAYAGAAALPLSRDGVVAVPRDRIAPGSGW